MKNLFNEKLDEVVDINPEHFKKIFRAFSAGFAEKSPGTAEQLLSLQQDHAPVSILLTSNFSETDRMSLEGEVEGYLKLLSEMRSGPNQTLLIKPHPRDSYQKMQILAERARDRYGKVLCLDDPWTFYVPFESLFDKYFCRENGVARANVEVATVSSACLSLEYLYGQPCVLGFGPDVVRRYFAENWQALRLIHEEDLTAIVSNLRNSQNCQELRKLATCTASRAA